MAFSPTGESLAFGSRDDSLHLWRIGDADAVRRSEGGALVTWVRRRTGAPWRLLSLGCKGTVNLYDPVSLRRDDWITQPGALGAVTSSGLLVTAEGDLADRIRVFPLGAEVPADRAITLPRFVGLSGRLSGLLANADATTMVLGGTISNGVGAPSDGFVLFWNRNASERPVLRQVDSAVLALAVTSDGSRVAAVGYEGSGDLVVGRARVFDSEKANEVLALPPQPKALTCAAFRPSSTCLAVGGADGVVRFFDAAGGRLRAWVKNGAPVSALAFNAPGDRLAVGGEDGSVRLYDVTPVVP